MNRPLFQIKKTWQFDKLSCVFQLTPVAESSRLYPKKIYLKLSAQAQEPPIKFLKEKPDFTPLKHAFNELLRKYAENAVLSTICYDELQHMHYLLLHTDKQVATPQYALVLTEKNPRSMDFVSCVEAQSIVRLGAQGTFTKRKAYELPAVNALPPQLEKLVAPLLSEALTVNDETPNETTGAHTLAMTAAQRDLIQKLRRRLRTINKSLQKQQQDELNAERIPDLEQQATLLQTYAHLVKPEAFELRLAPEQTGLATEFLIALDPERTVGEIVNDLFSKIKKRRRGVGIQAEQLRKTQATLTDLKITIERLEAESLRGEELQHLAKHFGIAKDSAIALQGQKETASPYKVYKSQGLRILVGKGAHENDELTKQAKANDFWLHAVGQSGSHVLVDCGKFRDQNLPELIFRDAAILALHYSKARQDRAGEVYYTRRGKIKKRKGMPPGLWNVEQAQTIFVRYNEAELKAVLDKMIS